MSPPLTHYPDSEPTVFALSLNREATNTNFTVFGFDQGLYPQSTTLEASMQTNHTTNVVPSDWINSSTCSN